MTPMTCTSTTLLLLSLAALSRAAEEIPFVTAEDRPLAGCVPDDYYAELLAISADPLQWPKEKVVELITSTHRTQAYELVANRPFDVMTGLVDLWPGSNEFNVALVYSEQPAELPVGVGSSILGWSRQHVWPFGRGYDEGPPVTDLHAKTPVDSTVATARRGLFFGVCGTVEDNALCDRPATQETDLTTETDGKVWRPNDEFIGDIARALFYNAARYEAEYGLTLTDCPPFSNTEYGYLSELKRWNSQDDPSTEELARTEEICTNWQGNRNVFVDYPQLVEVFWPGAPDDILPDSFTYSSCTEPTLEPTATPNTCLEDLEAGDIPVFLVNSEDPDQIVFFPLIDIPESVGSLFLTDNAWDGEKFLSNEGTYEIQIPEGGIPAGTIFGFGDNSPMADMWEEFPAGGQAFDIQTTNDNIFIYCLDADQKPNVINGWTNSGSWKQAGLSEAEYGTASSSLPENLEGAGSIALPDANNRNCIYSGPLPRDTASLAENLIDPALWRCQERPRIILDLGTSAGAITSFSVLATLATMMLSSFAVLL